VAGHVAEAGVERITHFGDAAGSAGSTADNVLAGARMERFGDLTSSITPRLSATLQLVPNAVAIRAAGGTAYKAPNLQEPYADNPFIAANPDIEPQTSRSVELGVDLRANDGRIAFGATAYHQGYDNLIRAVADAGSDRQINRNLGASRARGVEWELRVNAAAGWIVGTDGAVLATRVLDNTGLSESLYPEGEELPFRPSLTASAFVERARGRMSGLLRVRYIGGQTVLSERFGGDRVTLDPYLVLGGNINYGSAVDIGRTCAGGQPVRYHVRDCVRPAGRPARAALGISWRSR